MKTLPTLLVVAFAVVPTTFGKNLGFRRVRNDETGPLSDPTLDQAKSSLEYVNPTGCSSGRYLDPEEKTKGLSLAIESGRLDPVALQQTELKGQSLGKNPYRPLQFGTDDYLIVDIFRRRTLQFFDPEEWVCCKPNLPFPAELDIPAGWAIYNPVTVQAPQPTIIRDLEKYKYSGYYYACPNWVNPYDHAWYFNYNAATNPCKWIWYQSYGDAEVPVHGVTTDVNIATLDKPQVLKQNW